MRFLTVLAAVLAAATLTAALPAIRPHKYVLPTTVSSIPMETIRPDGRPSDTQACLDSFFVENDLACRPIKNWFKWNRW